MVLGPSDVVRAYLDDPDHPVVRLQVESARPGELGVWWTPAVLYLYQEVRKDISGSTEPDSHDLGGLGGQFERLLGLYGFPEWLTYLQRDALETFAYEVGKTSRELGRAWLKWASANRVLWEGDVDHASEAEIAAPASAARKERRKGGRTRDEARDKAAEDFLVGIC